MCEIRSRDEKSPSKRKMFDGVRMSSYWPTMKSWLPPEVRLTSRDRAFHRTCAPSVAGL